jgi:hypothetical protein
MELRDLSQYGESRSSCYMELFIQNHPLHIHHP